MNEHLALPIHWLDINNKNEGGSALISQEHEVEGHTGFASVIIHVEILFILVN